jgi:methyl-accepting chemotaxis protein
MKPVNRIFGNLLIAAAIGGLLFSLMGLFGTWIVRPNLIKTLDNSLNLVNITLKTTGQGLALTRDAMKSLVMSVSSVQSTLNTAGRTIEEIAPALDSVVALLDEDLPSTVTAVQTSLNSAYDTTRIIDGVMEAIAWFTGEAYNPAVPLHIALGDISASMNNLPGAFENMSESLTDTHHNMQTIQVDLVLFEDSIRQIESNLTEYEAVIDDYVDSILAVQQQIDELQKILPRIINFLALGSTFFFLWMIITQIGLFTQGRELLNYQVSTSQINSSQSEPTETENIEPGEKSQEEMGF